MKTKTKEAETKTADASEVESKTAAEASEDGGEQLDAAAEGTEAADVEAAGDSNDAAAEECSGPGIQWPEQNEHALR